MYTNKRSECAECAASIYLHLGFFLLLPFEQKVNSIQQQLIICCDQFFIPLEVWVAFLGLHPILLPPVITPQEREQGG